MIPARLQVRFDSRKADLVSDGLSNMLSAFYDACTLRQFVAVLINEVQQLFDAAIEVQRARTLYDAEGVNLDAIGRIVGQERAAWQYSEEGYFHFDIEGQGWDQLGWWCTNAPLGEYIEATDDVYRVNILSRIVKNHTLVSAVPEITALVMLLLNTKVSFLKRGPNTVCLVVPTGIDKTALWYLTRFLSDTHVDEAYRVPYPATLSLCDTIYYIPDNPFHFDREEPFQWDTAEWAVGAPMNR